MDLRIAGLPGISPAPNLRIGPPVRQIKLFVISITMAAPTVLPPTLTITPAPATADSICGLGYKVADTRADLLVGQGHILKQAGENMSAILRDANNNTQFTNANIDRTGTAGLVETFRNGDKLGAQANTIAWNEMGIQNAGFGESRAQVERINDAQSAFSDRAAKYNAQMTGDSFARLSAQGENGFARELDATTNGTRQVVQSEIGVTRSLGDGFRDGSAAAAANYASLTAQNCSTKEVVAAYGNRNSDQTASVLHSLTGQHSAITRDLYGVSKELGVQGALNAAATQLESAKNTAASQVQASAIGAAGAIEAAKNAAASQLQVSLVGKDLALQAAVNSKESVLQAAMISRDSLLEQSKWFALAEKTAMVNKCEIESKLAACCCEIKETVIGTSNATQSLIQSNESSRVRDALSAAVAENSILRLRREERPAPYPMPYPYPYPHHHRERSHSPHRGPR